MSRETTDTPYHLTNPPRSHGSILVAIAGICIVVAIGGLGLMANSTPYDEAAWLVRVPYMSVPFALAFIWLVRRLLGKHFSWDMTLIGLVALCFGIAFYVQMAGNS